MGEKKHLTVENILDMIDVNRESSTKIIIVEDSADDAIVFPITSAVLNLLSKMTVDSIDAEDGMVRIWLTDEAIDFCYSWKGGGA